MLFEIWTDRSGIGALVHDLTEEHRKEFLESGLQCVMMFEVTNEDEAKEEFIRWCQTQSPGATVEHRDIQKWLEGAA